ncbi:MAG: type restriction protein res subunit [Fibrobacteres bacterium]|nr:type restriction protein res subunit [Fibrobacterota bacterium]
MTSTQNGAIPSGPLIVQGDMTILLEVAHPIYAEARDRIAPFTELLKSPEHVHTYGISHLSLWNAASSGHDAKEVLTTLRKYSRFDLPHNLVTEIETFMERYGQVRIMREDGQLVLETIDPELMTEILNHRQLAPYIDKPLDDRRATLFPHTRGMVKMALTNIGFPAEDLAGYVSGAPLQVSIREKTLEGKPLNLRQYQKDAGQVFHAGGSEKGGSGVIVLPCGAGKTLVGLSTMAKCSCHTLILTTNVTAARQWIREILDKTTLRPDQVAEYTGDNKQIAPVTVATYQIITYRKRQSEDFPHFEIFSKNNWGLIIYDEVHLLPAPVFRISADMQATRRLGLTATLIREDGRQKDVFSLIGPKKFEVPWKVLEQQGWIATATCTEIRVSLRPEDKMAYAMADLRKKMALAASNPEKFKVVKELIQTHKSDRVLIIGQYLDQLDALSEILKVPLITGSTPNSEREVLYKEFRDGKIETLMVSKVGNFAVDIPDANVLIQISGTFGSRQEEAQRLGRVLRPKSNGSLAHFYTIITKDTKEQEFGMNRQLFLAEQGYSYAIVDWNRPVLEGNPK